MISNEFQEEIKELKKKLSRKSTTKKRIEIKR
jgi:hypothetical protein